MKKALLLGVVVYFTVFLHAREVMVSKTNSQQLTDTLITQLSLLNLNHYNGQPVDSLLHQLPPGYITMKIGGWRSQRLAEVLYVIYPNKIFVAIHVRNFQFMNPQLVNTSNPTQNWDITLFRKENISYSIIYNVAECINGCENKHK